MDARYPPCEELVRLYRDRVVGMLIADLLSNHGRDGKCINGTVPPAETYLHTYGIIHEHWHIEDWIQTRQTMGCVTIAFLVNVWGRSNRLVWLLASSDS